MSSSIHFPVLSVPPQYPFGKTYNDSSIVSDPEKGYVKGRKRFTVDNQIFSVNYTDLNTNDAELLHAHIAAVGKAVTFNWEDYLGNLYEVRFLKFSPVRLESHNRWTFDCELLEVNSGVAASTPTVTTLTISAGVLTIPNGSGYYLVDTENGDALDSLTKITGLNEGEGIILGLANAAHLVDLIDDDVYLNLQANFSLNGLYDRIALQCVGTDVCVEVSRSAN